MIGADCKINASEASEKMSITSRRANKMKTCDGTRKRRFSSNQARKLYYAKHRATRFSKRFTINPITTQLRKELV